MILNADSSCHTVNINIGGSATTPTRSWMITVKLQKKIRNSWRTFSYLHFLPIGLTIYLPGCFELKCRYYCIDTKHCVKTFCDHNFCAMWSPSAIFLNLPYFVPNFFMKTHISTLNSNDFTTFHLDIGPPGCLQYFTGNTGTFANYGYDTSLTTLTASGEKFLHRSTFHF